MVQPAGVPRPDAVRNFRNEMDRLFATFMNVAFPLYARMTPPEVGQPEGYASSPIDIEERPNHYLITMDAPGVAANNVEVTVADSVLTVTAQRSPSPVEDDVVLHTQERVHDPLRRTFRLTADIDHQAVTATVHDGEVQVTLPKTTPRTVRRIAIRS